MARRTILLSEVNLTEESVNLDVSGNLTVTGQGLFADGTAAAPSISFSSESNLGLYRAAADIAGWAVDTGSGTRTVMAFTGVNFQLSSEASLTWANTTNAATGTRDLVLARDAAAVLALKNADTAQTLRIYGDATAATLKYMTLTHDGTNALITTSGGTFGFGTHTTSAGTNINGVTGYISIVDSGGTPRRLAVLT